MGARGRASGHGEAPGGVPAHSSAARSRAGSLRGLCGLLIIYAASACSETALQPTPPPPPPETKALIDISGQLCSEPALLTPFPVKLLFVLDQSASLQCTDSENRRLRVLNDLIDRLLPQPNVSFAFIGFASWSRLQPFTRSSEEITPYLDPAQGLGPATDYQGALAAALQLLEQDMLSAGPALRARTRYHVIFVSDGAPEPRCRAGCEDDTTRCGDGIDNDEDGLIDAADEDCEGVGDNSLRPDSLYGVCNTDLEIPDGVYVDMSERCSAYNQPEQIQKRIDDLRSLELFYSVGGLTLNTVLLSSPQEVVEGVCPGASANFGYNTEQARSLLAGMARAGGGSFRDVNLTAGRDDFLDFNYDLLRSPYFVTELIAVNPNAIPGGDGIALADSDQDGLSDAEEERLGTDPLSRDSDIAPGGRAEGDGYGDLFEHRYRSSGFDPLDPSSPALPCRAREDRDGDGLYDCEELFLNSDPLHPDSDGDQLLDGLELRAGLDPLTPDATLDSDVDGEINRAELRAGRDPLTPDFIGGSRSVYQVEDRGERALFDPESGRLEQRRCYDFSVRNIPLAVTSGVAGRGRNRVYLHYLSRPLNLPRAPTLARQGCFEVFFPGDGTKDPQEIDLRPDRWAALRGALEAPVEALRGCLAEEEGALFDRPLLEEFLGTCLPEELILGRFLYTRDELIELLRFGFSRSLEQKLPEDPVELFKPLASFDPEVDCYQPFKLETLRLLLEEMSARCASCSLDEGSP